jgi:hypothetical protein
VNAWVGKSFWLLLKSFVLVNGGSNVEAMEPASRGGLKGGGGSGNDAKGLGACGHRVSWRRRKRGGGGDRGSSGASGGGVLAGASGSARGCWDGVDGLRITRGGCSRGDGSVNEGEAQDAVSGSWRAALGSGVVDVEGRGGRAWITGWRWFRWVYGGGEDVVISVWEEVVQATSPVEGGSREGAGVYGLFDSTGHLVAFPGEVGDVSGRKWWSVVRVGLWRRRTRRRGAAWPCFGAPSTGCPWSALSLQHRWLSMGR